jgi:6-phosphogluconolactonase (cycloisomerase 2 family)
VVDGNGFLTKIDEISTQGNGPTFTNPLSTGEVTGMNVSGTFVYSEAISQVIHDFP